MSIWVGWTNPHIFTCVMFGKGYRNISRTLNVISFSRSIECKLMLLLFYFWPGDVLVKQAWRVVVPRSGKLKPFYIQKRIHSKKQDVGKNSSNLNECTVLRFSVDKRSVRDHMGILVSKHQRKVRAEGKASGITPRRAKRTGKSFRHYYRFRRKFRGWITGIKSREKWKMWKRPSKGRRCEIKGDGKAVWDKEKIKWERRGKTQTTAKKWKWCYGIFSR